MKEADLQKAVATYLDYRAVLWCHVANERKTATRKRGGFFVGQGVKAGVPDCLIFEARGGFFGLAIELKSEKGRLSAQQKLWLNRLQSIGWKIAVCYSFDEAQAEIDVYLSGDETPRNLVY